MKYVETQKVELKESWSNDECLKEICSFANTDGGILYIGINDKGKVIGVKNSKKLLENIPNTIINELRLYISATLKTENKSEFIKIDINPSTIAISYKGKYYVRIGSTKQELAGQDLNNFLLKKSGLTWDEIIEERASLDDINISTIEKFKTLAIDKAPLIAKEKDWKVILEKLDLIQDTKIKRAGILLFGKNPQNFYSSSFVKIGKFENNINLLEEDTVKGNLFEQIENSLVILRTKYLKSNIKNDKIIRREQLEYPEKALRESIVNALIHRDYSGNSNIQIKIFDNSLIVSNEGKLPSGISIESLEVTHLSKPGNLLLAKIFQSAGYFENWGTGTLTIIKSALEQKLPSPSFSNESGMMSVILYKDIFNEEILKKILLNERQIKIAIFAKGKNWLAVSDFKLLVSDIAEKTLYRDLRDMVSKKIFIQIGDGRGRKYRINNKDLPDIT